MGTVFLKAKWKRKKNSLFITRVKKNFTLRCFDSMDSLDSLSLSLAIFPYCPMFLVTPRWHLVFTELRNVTVNLYWWWAHVFESIEHCSMFHVLLILDGLWGGEVEVSDCTAAVLWGAASKSHSKQHTTLCNCHLVFFSGHYIRIQVWQLYNNTDNLEEFQLYFYQRWDFHMVDNLSIAVHVFLCMLTLLSVDEILLLRYMNWSNFRLAINFWTIEKTSSISELITLSTGHE